MTKLDDLRQSIAARQVLVLDEWRERRTAMIAHGEGRLDNLEASIVLSIDGPRMTDEARELLARVAESVNARAERVENARRHWSKIGRPELLEQLDEELQTVPDFGADNRCV